MSINYFYRILIDNVPSPDGWMEHNEKSFPALMRRFNDLRDVNPRAVIRMEISPWYNKLGKGIYCPGCEYVSCPANHYGA